MRDVDIRGWTHPYWESVRGCVLPPSITQPKREIRSNGLQIVEYGPVVIFAQTPTGLSHLNNLPDCFLL